MSTYYCIKFAIENPDCASCAEFNDKDIRDDLRENLRDAGVNFPSLCFRLFHKNPKVREDWRKRFCKHFKQNSATLPYINR